MALSPPSERPTSPPGGGPRSGLRFVLLRLVLLCGYWIVYFLLETLSPVRFLAGFVMLAAGVFTFNPLIARLERHLSMQVSRRYVPEGLRASEEERTSRRGSLTGHPLGGYTLGHLIAKGGMSEVYSAQSGGLLLAIKVADTKQAPEFLLRFEREIAMLQRAKHPNVVQVFDHGVDQGYAYMVMEYIDGVSLKDYIAQEAPLPLKDIREIVQGISSAVDHMHGLGIVHRDLKPGNIMLYWEQNGICVPLLLDFGVAKQSAVTVITLEGTVGTVEYMSPEQILDAPLVQPSSDVYGIGVMVYEMLTGELPYDGSIGAIVFGHLHGDLKDPRDVNPEVPHPIADAVLRAMAKEPEDRFPSLSAFSREIAAASML